MIGEEEQRRGEQETERVREHLGRLRARFTDDALERLARSRQEYYSSHGHYVPELAALVLYERAERAALAETVEKGIGSLLWILNNAHNAQIASSTSWASLEASARDDLAEARRALAELAR